jgi:hypothetical protein
MDTYACNRSKNLNGRPFYRKLLIRPRQIGASDSHRAGEAIEAIEYIYAK